MSKLRAHAARLLAGADTWLPAMLLAVVVAYLLYTAGLFDRGYGRQRGMALIALTAVVVWVCRYGRFPRPDRTGVILAFVGAGLLIAVQLIIFAVAMTKPHYTDIGRSTIAAIEALWLEGKNPYSTLVDEVWLVHDQLFLEGFKYFPLMLLAYTPLVLAFGDHGIMLTNLLFHVAITVLVYRIARMYFDEGRASHPAFALLLSVITLTTATQLYRAGANDAIPIFLMLASFFALARQREGLSAVLVGASIAAKWFPGALFLVVLLPWVRHKLSFLVWSGATVFLFVAPFLAWDFWDFLSNSLLYQFMYPGDDSGFTHIDRPTGDVPLWRATLAPIARLGAAGLFFATLTAYVSQSLRDAPRDGDERLIVIGYCVLCMLFMLVAKSNHTNYLLWVIPFLALALNFPRYLDVPEGEVPRSGD